MVLNLFYEENNPDRWLPFDRYPRGIIRRILRGRPAVGGQQRLFLNLCAGLDQLEIDYRVNDYRHIRKHPGEIACIIGKSHLLDKVPWHNPILFGAAVHSHPLEDPELLNRLPVKKVLVPGEWMRKMWEPYYGKAVIAWPVGIDTDTWRPLNTSRKSTDFLIYDKVRWEHDQYERSMLQPIRNELSNRGLSFSEIRYGFYIEEDFRRLLGVCRAMIFLCEHETQGIAYQQALSCGVPILAWDKGGICGDPSLLARGINFGPVTSVPYWDERCGTKFASISEFHGNLDAFVRGVREGVFKPRDYVLENLTLQKCANDYFDLVRSCTA